MYAWLFFFQAEDGIRDIGVTGVQTCALPILPLNPSTTVEDAGVSSAIQLFTERARAIRPDFGLTDETLPAVADIVSRLDGLPLRSGERRVGEEGQYRRVAVH